MPLWHAPCSIHYQTDLPPKTISPMVPYYSTHFSVRWIKPHLAIEKCGVCYLAISIICRVQVCCDSDDTGEPSVR